MSYGAVAAAATIKHTVSPHTHTICSQAAKTTALKRETEREGERAHRQKC